MKPLADGFSVLTLRVPDMKASVFALVLAIPCHSLSNALP